MNNDNKLLDQFLQEWPLERVKTMTLEEYTNTDKTSFCYWLESLTQSLGSIWGGSSFKFGIFKRADTSKVETRAAYKSEGDYAWVGKYGETKEEAFLKIKSIILDIIDCTQNKEFEKIVSIDLGTAYKWKIAFMYSDFSLIPIYNKKKLQKAAVLVGLKKENNFYNLQKSLLDRKNENLDVIEYANELLELIAEDDKPEVNESDSAYNKSAGVKLRYWMYAPGPKAIMWDEFYSKGIMAIEWDALGDLSEYPDKLSIATKLQEVDESDNPGSKKNDSTACYEFANVVSPGDIVFVKSKQRELVGYGVVRSEYYFSTERESYKSCVDVEWKAKGNWPTDFNLVQKTLTDVTKYKGYHPDYKLYSEELMAIIKGEYTPITRTKGIEYPLNQILFGPPGTGKTYNSINHALAIIEGKVLEELETESEENRKEVLDRYKALVDAGQIVFTTFHQSMCYEDFIEGIKPVELDSQLSYEVQSGILKTIAEKALLNYKSATKQTAKKPFDEAWAEYLKPLSEEDTIQVQMKKSSFIITHVSDKTIFFEKGSGDSKHTLSINTLKAMYAEGKNNIIKGGLQPYYEPLLSVLLQESKQTKTEELKDFVVIIDEINRGNVSQIFGELITLLEKDKRLGADEQLTATLPYSKQKGFGVPSNLYIIGTMNTADRSVEALDTALRRRFSFVEMPPNYELSQLENEVAGISLLTILETINGRIEKLLDKDHLIGHSYFLAVEDIKGLQDVFQQNIVPLLQEYFYGDMAKIGLVLGKAFFEKQKNGDNIQFASFDHDAIDDLNARQVRHLKNYWTEGEFEQAIKDLVNPA